MAQAYAIGQDSVKPGMRGQAVGFAAFLLIALLAFLAVDMQAPPSAVGEGAPIEEFSSARAMNYLRAIAASPHPIGSREQAELRRYIVDNLTALGLAPEIQEATSVSRTRGGPFIAGTVRNIVARIEGAENSRALMIVGHYDSVPNGHGASDDGSAVAGMLETARALKAGPQLKNDVIFLFTDGEETGLLGANSFVENRAWLEKVGLVLNFEARGNGGSSVLFETSPGNGWLVGELAEAAPYPQGNSLAQDVYKVLPNDTDLTVFKQAGVAGMNFAFFEGASYYHSPIDDIERIDERSLQHQGSYMFSLARHFGNLDLRNTRAGNAVYFNLFSSTLIHYPAVLAFPLVAVAVLGFVVVLVIGFKRQLLTVSRIVLGALAFLLAIIVPVASVFLAWWLISRPRGVSLPQGDTYNSPLYVMAFLSLTLIEFILIYKLMRIKLSFENLAAGALLVWVILAVASAVLFTGASYLFTWPLLFSLLAAGLSFAWKDALPEKAIKFAAICACAIPIVMLFSPVVRQLFAALTLSFSWAAVALISMALGLLIPQIEFISALNRRVLPLTFTIACAVLLIASSMTAGFNARHPRPNSIIYVLDADKNKAVWASNDKAPDVWTSQFLSSGVQSGTLFDYFPFNPRRFLKSEAPAAQLQAPEAVVLSQSNDGEWRTMRLKIRSPRQAPVISVYIDWEGKIAEASINGKPVEGQVLNNRPGFLGGTYYALPPEGIEVSLKVSAAGPVKIKLVDRSYQLTETGIAFQPRPNDLIAAPFSNSDSVFVSKSFTF